MKIVKKIFGFLFTGAGFVFLFVLLFGIYDTILKWSTYDDPSAQIIAMVILAIAAIIFLLFGKILLKNKDNKLNKIYNNYNNISNDQTNINKKNSKIKNVINYPYFVSFPVYAVDSNNNKVENYDITSYISIEDMEEMAKAISNLVDKDRRKNLSRITVLFTLDNICKVHIGLYEKITQEELSYYMNLVSQYIKNNPVYEIPGKDVNLCLWNDLTSWVEFDNKILEKFYEEYKRETAKECYSIELIEEEPDILDNKIGGNPYIPIGEEIPKDREGNDMALLLQVNLADIDLENYPKDGILEIFVPSYFGYGDDYYVKYYKSGLEYKKDLPQIEYGHGVVDKAYKIKLTKTISHMTCEDYRYNKVVKKVIEKVFNIKFEYEKMSFYIQDLLGENYTEGIYDYNLYQVNVPKISIGGYADFTQGDPRSYECEDMDECLFKLDSMYDYEKINIGDSGILFALINEDDLKNANFEKTFVDFDCM